MSAVPATIRAGEADIPALTDTLARAFMDDPVACWSCPVERLRMGVLERFQSARLRQLLKYGEIWMSSDRACAALWAPPGHWRTTVREDLEIARAVMHPRLLGRLPLSVAGLLGIERKHPRQPPHWYLAVLGTEPAAQGRGLGSAVLGRVLEQCDADGVAAYLESSKERNIDFYARHGFKVMEELRLPRGPRMWPMWREPRP